MDTTLRKCIICGSVDGESKDGIVVRLGDDGMCNVCREMIPLLTEKYRVDFQQRLGQKVTDVIPYPFFKAPHFNFPPYSEVYTASSYMDVTIRFAVGLAENCIVGGRRSHQSLLAGIEQEIEDVNELLEKGVGPDEGEVLRFRRRQLEFVLEKHKNVTKKKIVNLKFGYNPDEEEEETKIKHVQLFTIPYRDMGKLTVTDKGDWLKVKISHRALKTGFFGGKKWMKDSIYWIISREARPFLNELEKRIENAE